MKTEKCCDNCKYSRDFVADKKMCVCIKSIKENKKEGTINVEVCTRDEKCGKWESKDE